MITRRGSFVALAAGLLPGCADRTASARVVVVGGGIGGASAARALKATRPNLRVTLIERQAQYHACPFSNLVITGQRTMAAQRFDYTRLRAQGIDVRIDTAKQIDPVAHRLTLESGAALDYDRMILAPGIDLKFDAIEGYDRAASLDMPHAWQAGTQTSLLAKRLAAMPDGGVFVMAIPENPYRCPPGPYERASLVAHYLATQKPKSKVLLLDSKDRFSKQGLFQQSWQEHYPGLIEWQGAASGARLRRVDAKEGLVETEFDRHRATVANIIPPQRAAAIAQRTGVTDASGWCPIDPLTFESTQAPDIHIIGDAAIANAMPKSAFSANAQAKVCAVQILRLLSNAAPLTGVLLNTCYSFVTPNHAISVAGVYRPGANRLDEVAGAGGVSVSLDDDDTQRDAVRRLEAGYANAWFDALTYEAFGA